MLIKIYSKVSNANLPPSIILLYRLHGKYMDKNRIDRKICNIKTYIISTDTYIYHTHKKMRVYYYKIHWVAKIEIDILKLNL